MLSREVGAVGGGLCCPGVGGRCCPGRVVLFIAGSDIITLLPPPREQND